LQALIYANFTSVTKHLVKAHSMQIFDKYRSRRLTRVVLTKDFSTSRDDPTGEFNQEVS